MSASNSARTGANRAQVQRQCSAAAEKGTEVLG